MDPEGVREVPARYNLFTRDTLVDGRPFSERFPLTDAYAQGAEWFIDNGPMERAPYRYGKYGIPFYFAAHELKRVGDYRGVMLFARVEESGEPYSGLYAAVRPDCAFQTYSSDMMIASVRG